MKKRKKGEITGQLFVFLLAIILFGLILIYGYKAVKTFGEKSKETAFIEFKENLQTAIRTALMDYGSVKKFQLAIPSNYKEVCFIDLETLQIKNTRLNELANTRPLIFNAIETGTSQNIFLVPMAESPLQVEKLSIDEGFICFENIKIGVSLRLEGKGKSVGISRW